MSSGAQRADEAEIAELIDQARAEARADVVAELRRRFADELLERALEALRAPVVRDAGLCVLGVVEPGREPEGVAVVTRGRVSGLVAACDAGELDDLTRL